jgi:hypothetical protein
MSSFWDTESLHRHAICLVRSFHERTGRSLIQSTPSSTPAEIAKSLYGASFVVVSHGTESDPILNYGNALALNLWEMTWEEFTRTPSRLTAEPPNRDERARLLAEVSARGFIDNYSGIRISKNGRRFRIERATVWNLTDEQGHPCGQAATFGTWIPVS